MPHRSFQFQRDLDTRRQQNIDNQTTPRAHPSGRAVSYPVSFVTGSGGHGGGANGPTFSGDTSKYVRYVRNQNMINLWFTIPMQLATFHGGYWNLLLPGQISTLNALSTYSLCRGYWEAINGTTGAYSSGWVELYKPSSSGFNPNAGSPYAQFLYLTANPGTPNYLSDTVPWAWTVNDQFSGFVTYECADLYTP